MKKSPRLTPLVLCSLVCLSQLASACRPAVDIRNPSPFDEDDPEALERAELERIEKGQGYSDDDFKVASQAAYDEETREISAVTRAALDRVLNDGIGTFLARVDISPHLDVSQRFVGWEVLSHSLSGVDIKNGDIIKTVNEHRLERPTQVQEMWENLRQAKTIQIAGERSGKPFLLKVEVVAESPPATP